VSSVSAEETAKAVQELLAELGSIQRGLMSDPLLDEQSRLEGHRWIFSLLAVALESQVWSDRHRPMLTEVVGRYRKWGGDNADAFYHNTALDPARTYRISGSRGDAVYLSLTVYGGPDDGHYSTRIVGSANDRTMVFEPDGRFEVILSPDPQEGNWIKLEPDAVFLLTRDYVADPVSDRRTQWNIECLDGPDTRPPETDASLARRFTAAVNWLREQATLRLPLVDDNGVDEPYPVPQNTFGWAAGDAAYAAGSFSLAADQALVLQGRSPECVFWNVCLWNPFLHTYDYAWERVTLNGHQLVYEPDGSWQVVIAATDPGHPNWISTAGHPRGRIWFRWFLPDETPKRPNAKVVALKELA
jgi:hypothetical protein